jgi:uncharacterized membrane protein YqiK
MAGSIPQVIILSSLPNWVMPVYVVVPSALFLIGMILFFMDRNLRGMGKENALNISRELRDLQGEESHYHVGHTGNAGPSE